MTETVNTTLWTPTRSLFGLTMTILALLLPGLSTAAGDSEPVSEALYLVRLSAPPVATYDGSIAGLDATSPEHTGRTRLNTRSPAVAAYLGFLDQGQDSALRAISAELGRALHVPHRYRFGNNGFAVRLSPAEARRVEALPGMVHVERETTFEPQGDRTAAFVGATGVWDGSTTGGLGASAGEGVIVGVIDTGINPANPAFADIANDGHNHTNPWGQGVYVGVCDSNDPLYDPTFPCNDKLIGARAYAGANGINPLDTSGHGTGMAAAAAGGRSLITINAPTTSTGGYISGVAPHANIVAYAACCSSATLAAAIDDAIADQVDVINFSISGGASGIWNSYNSVGLLNARAAGVSAVVAAANAGPTPGTVGMPGVAPWVTSTAGTSHDRAYQNMLYNLTGGATTPPGTIFAKGFTAAYGPALIVHASAFGDGRCLSPFPGGTWSGEIVVCDRGINDRVDKGTNVLAGGASGMVLANVSPNANSVVSDPHVLPAVHINLADAQALATWMSQGSGHTASILGWYHDSFPDQLLDFSGRGPNTEAPDVLVPTLAAPAVEILAATGTGGAVEWTVATENSFSAAHVTGATAVLRGLHPDWTPAHVESALATTAFSGITLDGLTPTTPFDRGSGRIDVSAAARAGLVMHESYGNYLAANPSFGGRPRDLNLPSLTDGDCAARCTWTRRVSNALGAITTWDATLTLPPGLSGTVSPSSFVLGVGDSQDVEVTVDVDPGAVLGIPIFGELQLVEQNALGSPAHLPISVTPAASNLPEALIIDTRRDAGSVLIPKVRAWEITDLTVSTAGLAIADLEERTLTQDPTNGDAFDNLDDGTTFVITTTTTAQTRRLEAEIVATSAPDIDLYVGTGAVPSPGTIVCASASPVSAERCSISDPIPGDWWIVVQSFTDSGAPDPVTLAWAAIEAGAGNLRVVGPPSQPPGAEFDLQVLWDEPAMSAGDRLYGSFTLGTSDSTPGDIGRVEVDLVRHPDDVTVTAAPATVVGEGETVSLTVAIASNVTTTDLTYTVTDTLPTGLTLDPGSISSTGGGNVSVIQGGLTWTVTLIPNDPSGTQLVFDATVDPGTGGQTLTNLVEVITDNPGDRTDSVETDILVTPAGLIFADGFESSDTSLWSASTTAAAPSPSGTDR